MGHLLWNLRGILKTVRTKIDYVSGVLTMEFEGNKVEFNIYDAMQHPVEVHSLCTIDMGFTLPTNAHVISVLMDEKGKLPIDPLGIGPNLLTPSEKLVPSIMQAPEIELK